MATEDDTTDQKKSRLHCYTCKAKKLLKEFSKNSRSLSGYQSQCKACNKIYADRYRQENRLKIREESRAYYLKHKLERYIYYLENVEHKKEYDRNYTINNYEKVKAKDKAKRARKKGSTIEKFTDLEIFTRDKWICQLCNKKVNKRLKYPNPLSSSLDHVIPLSKGGQHSRQNCCLVHLQCNNRKQNRNKTQQQRLF